MTSGVVTFDVAAFVARYPQFAAYNTANPGMLQLFFNEATLLLKNTPTSLVRDLTERAMLLNMITAHLALLAGVLAPGGAGSTAGQVGRVSSATEGTVSATLDMGAVYGKEAWWLQSQYGATYWQMTAKYRTMRVAYPRACRC
jgi:hypothetical protein